MVLEAADDERSEDGSEAALSDEFMSAGERHLCRVHDHKLCHVDTEITNSVMLTLRSQTLSC